jgi:pyruvate/2-oxoglutarate dehydrogenase complex dihydrolipoamide dehydrogenase (E3) component
MSAGPFDLPRDRKGSPLLNFDVVVIGGGSGGYAAARTAQEAGANVAIVDHGPLGGLCILKGCMPTKTILRSSDVMALMGRSQEFGILPVQAITDLGAINDRKNRIIGEFAQYRSEQLQDPRFTLFEDVATFESPHEVRVGTQTLRAENFVIATGSKIAHFPIPGLEDAGYITSDDVLEMREAPKSMIVLGAGPVALELAQFLARIGVKISLIQRSDHILSSGDEDIAQPVEARLREEGMDVYTGTQLLSVSKDGDERVISFVHEGEEKSVRAEKILQALGRTPNTDGLNLEAAGVKRGKKGIEVNAEMRTSQPHIFAVGDVNGLHEIVHIAIEQGEIAAYNAVHSDRPPRQMDDRLKTSIVFTDPAVAGVGLSEKECKAQDIPYLAASYPFDDHGKSICLGETHGHVKLICEPQTGELLGAHIVGPEAGELIHQLITLMHFHGTVFDIVKIPHYHPTLSEIITYPAEELIEQLNEIRNVRD